VTTVNPGSPAPRSFLRLFGRGRDNGEESPFGLSVADDGALVLVGGLDRDSVALVRGRAGPSRPAVL
jgi:hypothetical protein